jgi:hypothetical protein
MADDEYHMSSSSSESIQNINVIIMSLIRVCNLHVINHVDSRHHADEIAVVEYPTNRFAVKEIQVAPSNHERRWYQHPLHLMEPMVFLLQQIDSLDIQQQQQQQLQQRPRVSAVSPLLPSTLSLQLVLLRADLYHCIVKLSQVMTLMCPLISPTDGHLIIDSSSKRTSAGLQNNVLPLLFHNMMMLHSLSPSYPSPSLRLVIILFIHHIHSNNNDIYLAYLQHLLVEFHVHAKAWMILENKTQSITKTCVETDDDDNVMEQVMGDGEDKTLFVSSTRLVVCPDYCRNTDENTLSNRTLLEEECTSSSTGNHHLFMLQSIARMYCEIMVDCLYFDDPVHVFEGLKLLCDMVLNLYSSFMSKDDHANDSNKVVIRLLLACIGYILSYRDDTTGYTFIDIHEQVKKEIWNLSSILIPLSTLFEDSSWWIDSTFTEDDTTRVTYTLQKWGILSFIDDWVETTTIRDEDIIPPLVIPSNKNIHLEWPFPIHLSMKKAFLRIGPQYPVTNPFSKTSRYERSMSRRISRNPVPQNIKHERDDDDANHPTTPSLLNYLCDDTIRVVFSFLGYKLLVRATSVCKDWNRIGNEDIFWKPMYLKRFPKAIQPEMIVKEQLHVCEQIKSAYLDSNKNYVQNWRRLFDWKWKMEKSLHRKHLLSSKCSLNKSRPKTCDFVGCQTVLYGEQSVRQHAQNHIAKLGKEMCLFEKRHTGKLKRSTI